MICLERVPILRNTIQQRSDSEPTHSAQSGRNMDSIDKKVLLNPQHVRSIKHRQDTIHDKP